MSPSKSQGATAKTRKPLGIADTAPIFAALGDATRLALVVRLGSGGPLSIAQLTAGSAVTRQAITKHLNVLLDAGLVRDARQGRQRMWEFDVQRLDAARRCIDDISEQWHRALLRLKAFVEQNEQ